MALLAQGFLVIMVIMATGPNPFDINRHLGSKAMEINDFTGNACIRPRDMYWSLWRAYAL